MNISIASCRQQVRRPLVVVIAAFALSCGKRSDPQCSTSSECHSGVCVDGRCIEAGPADAKDTSSDEAHDVPLVDDVTADSPLDRQTDISADDVTADSLLDRQTDISGTELCNDLDDDSDGLVDENVTDCTDGNDCTADICVAGLCAHAAPIEGAVFLFDRMCPDGFAEVDELRSRFIRGHDGDLSYGETGGSTSHRHVLASHVHSVEPSGAHNHSVTLNYPAPYGVSNGGLSVVTQNHSHTASSSDSVVHTHTVASASETLAAASNLPAYREAVFCSAQTGTVLIPTGAMALYNGLCPDGWTEEADFRNRMLRGHDADDTYGEIGGSDSHEHTATHTHTLEANSEAHGHEVTVGTATGGENSVAEMAPGPGVGSAAALNHTHVDSTLTDTLATHTHTAPAPAAFLSTELPPWREYVVCRKDASATNQTAHAVMRLLWVGAPCPACWDEEVSAREALLRGHDGDSTYEETGGESSHVHDGTHGHGLSTMSGAHSHDVAIGLPSATKNVLVTTSTWSVSAGDHAHSGTVGTGGEHQHTILSSSTTSEEGDLIPPFTEVVVCAPE